MLLFVSDNKGNNPIRNRPSRRVESRLFNNIHYIISGICFRRFQKEHTYSVVSQSTTSMMENTTSSFDTSPEANGSNVSAEFQLPSIAVIYTPIIAVQLLVGLVSNIFLATLLIKARNELNNINIYLSSIAVNNLLFLFPLLTLMVSTATQRWIFGQTMCTVNQVIVYIIGTPNIFLPAFISRERYRAVLHFFEWKPHTKRTYIEVGVVWIIAGCVGLLGLLQGGQIVGETDDVISCIAPSRWLKESFSSFYIVYLVLATVFNIAALLFCVVHYIYIFRQLSFIKKKHSSTLSQWYNYQDVPIQWKSELKALNAMACVFIITAVPSITFSLYYTSVASLAFAKGTTFTGANVPLLHIFIFCFYSLTTASPMVIMIVNEQFKMRVKKIFRLEVKPDHTTTSGVATSNIIEIRLKDKDLN